MSEAIDITLGAPVSKSLERESSKISEDLLCTLELIGLRQEKASQNIILLLDKQNSITCELVKCKFLSQPDSNKKFWSWGPEI
jgi:hypothetical protein